MLFQRGTSILAGTARRPMQAARCCVGSDRGMRPAGVARAGPQRAPGHAVHGQIIRAGARRSASHVVCCVGVDGDADTVELELKVEGMVCGGCSSRVEEALKGMANVKAVTVSLENKMANIEVQAPTMFDALSMLPQLVDTVKGLGFEAEPHIEYEHL